MTIKNIFSQSLLSFPLSHPDIPPTVYEGMLIAISEKTHHPQMNLQYVVSMMASSHLNVLHPSTVTLPMAFSAHTAAKYSAVLSGVFWHIVCAESKKKKKKETFKSTVLIISFCRQQPVPPLRKEPLITCGEWALIVCFFCCLCIVNE